MYIEFWQFLPRSIFIKVSTNFHFLLLRLYFCKRLHCPWILRQTSFKLTSISIDHDIAVFVYQINEFLETDHWHGDIILNHIRVSLISVINRSDIRISSAESTDRTKNHFIKPRFWSVEWITNKTVFCKAIRSFEQTIFASAFSEDSSFTDVIFESSFSSTSQSSGITEEILRIDMSDQGNGNAEPASVFIIVQKRELIVIMIEVLRSQSILSPLFFDDNENDDLDNHRSASIIHFVENVEFFDFDYVDVDNFVIVNVGRHVFYKNVYVFGNRLKDLAKGFTDEQRMRELVSKCLRGEAFK